MGQGRITWQNIAAPDFRSAMLGQISVGNQLGEAAAGIRDSLVGIDQNARNVESQAAQAEMMKIQDIDAWNKAMAAGGIGGFAANPARLNPSVMEFAKGYGDELTSDRETERAYGMSVFNDNRNKIEAGRADLSYARTEEERALGEKAAKIVADLSASGKYTNAADLAIGANNWVETEGKNDPKLAQAVMGQLGQVDPAGFATSSGALTAAQSTPEYQLASQALASRVDLFKFNNSTNPLTQAYIDGTTAFGSSDDPIKGLIAEVTSSISKTTPEGEPNAIWNQTAGYTQDLFNDLKKANPKVPDAAIVSLMKRTVQSDGWVFSGDQIETAKAEIGAQLEKMSSPDAIRGFEMEQTKIEAQMSAFTNQQAAMDKLVADMALAESQNRPEAYAKARAELLALTGSMEAPAPAAEQGAAVAPPQAPQTDIGNLGAANAAIPGGQNDIRVPGQQPGLAAQMDWGSSNRNAQGPQPDPRMILDPEEAAMTPRDGRTEIPYGEDGPLPEGVEPAGLGTALADFINPNQFKEPENIQSMLDSGEITPQEAQIILRGSNQEVDKIFRKVLAKRQKNQ